jgi:hypothetical protein
VLKKIIYLKGYYYSELSLFPQLNHSKNHFYFEFMKENYDIASNEWFIPIGWKRGSIESVLEEKATAKAEASEMFANLKKLEGKLPEEEYKKLYLQFANLNYVARAWVELTDAYIAYARYFETKDAAYETKLFTALDNLLKINEEGIKDLDKDFYCVIGDGAFQSFSRQELIKNFVKDTKESFEIEKKTVSEFEKENLVDYVVCGGANEGHRLQKEVNFSDTLVIDGALCRIPGNRKGMKWATINAHGWFSYELKVKAQNTFEIEAGASGETLDMKITLGENEFVINEKIEGKKIISLPYENKNGDKTVRIRFDRLSGSTPCIYSIKVK